MADTTPNLNLPFILPSQAQKHVTHNEALLALDTLAHLAVLDELSEPPALPAEGARYIVGGSASSLWAGKDGAIAAWQDGAWNFLEPREGWRAWFVSSHALKVFSSGDWRDTLPASAGFSMLGVSATPDGTNRLAVSSDASLFNHAGNDHQIKVNKAAATDTASLVFQSGFTGHAEMGLSGENAFSIKVSDGTDWKTGISVHPAGHVSRPNQPVMRAYRSGTAFLPVDGQQSGFTHIGPNQGGFALGDILAGGGNRIIVPVDGIYLACLNVRTLSSSGHVTTLVTNGSQSLLSLAGPSGGSGTQAACGVFGLSAGDMLALAHAGTAELGLGDGNTQLSVILL